MLPEANKLKELHDLIKNATGQVVDTYREIDIYWERCKTDENRKKYLLYVVDGLDDDIQVLRYAQRTIRGAIPKNSLSPS